MSQTHACLLLHGFSGTPFELEHLATLLQQHGIVAKLPTLPGHGQTLAEFRKSHFSDWLAEAEKNFEYLLTLGHKVSVLGFSMGGTLALHLAAKYPVEKAFCIAPPIFGLWSQAWFRKDMRVLLTPLLRYIFPVIKFPSNPESRILAPYKNPIEGFFCVEQYLSLIQGLADLRKRMKNITCPLFLVHDIHDRISDPKGSLYIAQNVASCDTTLRYTAIKESVTSKHMLTTHQETKSIIESYVTDFIAYASK